MSWLCFFGFHQGGTQTVYGKRLCGRCDPIRYRAALHIETWLYQREDERKAVSRD